MKLKQLILLLFISAQSFGQITEQKLFGQSGFEWKALVTVPNIYNSTTDSFVLILFTPGAGEIGSGYPGLQQYGPHARLNGGWDGSVSLGGDTVIYPIIISLEPNTDFPQHGNITSIVIDSILANYRIKRNSVLATGFSAGGYTYKIVVTEDAYDVSPPYGPFQYADHIRAIFDLQGVQPDDNPNYLNTTKNFARNKWGGRYLGFWGTADGIRQMDRFADSMNIVVPGSAMLYSTSDAHNATAWNRFYGSSAGSAPQKFNIEGISQDIYQWLVRQGDLSDTPDPEPPTPEPGKKYFISLTKFSN